MAGLLVWGLRMEPPTSSEGPAPKPPRYYLGELRSPAPLSGGGFQTLPYSRNEQRALDCGPVSHFWWRRRESGTPVRRSARPPRAYGSWGPQRKAKSRLPPRGDTSPPIARAVESFLSEDSIT